MPGLPLLKLPFLVRDIIIKCLTLLEIFELSTTSKRSLYMMKQTRINMDYLNISLLPARLRVAISRGNETLDFWTKYVKKTKNVQYRQVDGSQVQLLEFKQITESYLDLIFNAEMKTVESELEVLERITKHLYTFIKFGKTFLHFDKQQINLKNLFIWNYTQRFDRVLIPPRDWSPLKITSEQLIFLLENVEAENMELNVSIIDQPGFKYQYSKPEPSKIERLKIVNSNWVNLENLLKMDIQRINCKISQGLEKKINIVLKSWISGENEKLEELEIGGNIERERDLNLKTLFAGITNTPTVFTDEELRSRGNELSDTTKDIRREKDGLHATVCSYPFGVSLLVWKEEHLRAIGRS